MIMRFLLAVGCFAACVAVATAADDPKDEAPLGDLGGDFSKKFADIDLWDRTPRKKEAPTKEAPPKQEAGDKAESEKPKEKPDDDSKSESLADTSDKNKKPSEFELPAHLSGEMIDLVWAKIDADKNEIASDREVAAAAKRLRAIINSKKGSPLRDAARASLGMPEGTILSQDDTVALVARVRGMKCPTAARAKEFFAELDANGSSSVDSKEILARLSDIGAVGRYLANILAPTLRYIDLNDDHEIDMDEALYSSNILLRLKLATQGEGLARRNPIDWMQIVSAVSMLDLDADNAVSPTESTRVRSLAVDFRHIDKNRDKLLSASELSNYQEELQRIAAAEREAAYREQVERMRALLAYGRSSRNAGNNGGSNKSRRKSTSRNRKQVCLT